MGSKENTALALGEQVIFERVDLLGLHGVSIQAREHINTRRKI
jgi:hypothetical protein